MRFGTFFFLIFFFLMSISNAKASSDNILIYLPSIIAAASNNETIPHEIYPLELWLTEGRACSIGELAYGEEIKHLKNRYSINITIVKMEIINSTTWQFDNTNSLPITLAPGDNITYSTSHISGYPCGDPPVSKARVKFVFADGNFQNIE